MIPNLIAEGLVVQYPMDSFSQILLQSRLVEVISDLSAHLDSIIDLGYTYPPPYQ